MTKRPFSILKIILIFVLVCGVSIMFVWLFGNVRGEEFSPNRFARREFSYFQIPFVGTQLTPVSFSKPFGGTDPLVKHLRANGLLSSVRSKAVRWDIVTLKEPGRNNDKGDAEILTKYLDQRGAFGGDTWLEWTEDPETAEVAETLWPLVADLAYEELYILLPDLFDLARRYPDIDEFVKAVHEELPTSIRKVAESEKVGGNAERASQLESFASRVAILEATPYETPESDDSETEESNTVVDAEADPEDVDVAEP